MIVDYIYCNSCGLEGFDCHAEYSRQTANGDWYYCPNCKQETSNVDTGCEDNEET